MAFKCTQTEYDQVRDAYLALVIGRSVVKVTIDGDTTEFTQRTMPQLRSLLNEMEAYLSPSANAFQVVTEKGL